MASEREVTMPVDLCDGRRLASAARGWARQPLFRANLRGAWGRKKRWDYWCVITPEVIATVTYADIDYAGLASCWILDRQTEMQAKADVLRPFGRGFSLPDQVCTGKVSIDIDALSLSIEETADATRLSVAAPSSELGAISIDVSVDKPIGHESLNVVIPWSDRKFQFTSKQNTRAASGTITAGDTTWAVGAAEDFAVQDLGRGIWPYSNRWNWASASGRSVDGHLVGLQFGGKWTEGTGHTENALCIDGHLTKIHDEVEWEYSWDEPLRPWRIRSDRADVTLTPTFDRYDNTDLKLIKMEVHQCFGSWSGWVRGVDDTVVTLDGISGFAEEARNRW